ncbi:MAG: hypothetical protein OER21_00900 [Gemmatimonadota bacterium]|nr:hypothetical protein [Gemmatimonadota bacterium]
MRPRTPSVLLLLTACAGTQPGVTPLPPRPAVLTYGPWTGRYVFVRHRHVEQVFQGQPLVTDLTSHLWLSVTTSVGDPGLRLELVVDSARVRGSGLAPGSAEGARGRRFEADLYPDGRLEHVVRPSVANPLIDQLAFDLVDLLPLLPPGGARSAATWTDTTRSSGALQDMTLSIQSVNTRSTADWSAIDGGQGLEFNTAARFTVTGRGEQAGQPFTLSGEGQGHAQHWLGAGGRLLRLIRGDSTRIDVDLPGVGLIIPVMQQTTDTVRAVL